MPVKYRIFKTPVGLGFLYGVYQVNSKGKPMGDSIIKFENSPQGCLAALDSIKFSCAKNINEIEDIK